MHPVTKGILTEIKIAGKIIEKGWNLFKPLNSNTKIDFLLEKEDQFLRVQCKHGRVKDGVVRFNLSSYNPFMKEHKGYQGAIDLFIVWASEIDKYYMIPIQDFHAESKREASLRISAPKNNQCKKIRWAKDYEI